MTLTMLRMVCMADNDAIDDSNVGSHEGHRVGIDNLKHKFSTQKPPRRKVPRRWSMNTGSLGRGGRGEKEN